MNGEMYNACKIVAAAKKALKEKSNILYKPDEYENNIIFSVLPQNTLFNSEKLQLNGVFAWFEHCEEKGLKDILFLTPTTTKNRSLLGFSNATPNSFVCFYKNRKTTYFAPNWEFNSVLKLWNITYTEQVWRHAPIKKPKFKDNTADFVRVLNNIQELAQTINCENFASIFKESVTILTEGTNKPSFLKHILPPNHFNIFMAASNADVFGAMGSWNDSPPYLAHEKKLDKEYERLSAELLKQLRLSVLYAINEW